MQKKLKEIISLENILCLYIIVCPILDIISFMFRNIFSTSISPSTFLRPTIAIIVATFIFIKSKQKRKNHFYMYYICFLWVNSFSYISNYKN